MRSAGFAFFVFAEFVVDVLSVFVTTTRALFLVGFRPPLPVTGAESSVTVGCFVTTPNAFTSGAESCRGGEFFFFLPEFPPTVMLIFLPPLADSFYFPLNIAKS